MAVEGNGQGLCEAAVMGRGRSGTVGEDRESLHGNVGSGSGNGRWRGKDVGR